MSHLTAPAGGCEIVEIQVQVAADGGDRGVAKEVTDAFEGDTDATGS